MRKCSLAVVEGGGIVRGIHNHGIRTLPHRFKAKYADQRGIRYYEKGRFFSIYYDANPDTMRMVEQILTMDEDVLRNTHLKARSILDQVNVQREERNPFLRQVEQMQRKQQQQQREQQQKEESNVVED
jgi:ribosomal protein S6